MGSKLRDKPLCYPASKGTQSNLFGDKRDNFQLAFRIGKLKFYGGPEDRLSSRCWDTIIHLTEKSRFTIFSTHLRSCPKSTKMINIPCHNNDSPLMIDARWGEIIKHLPVEGNVAVSCYGGKGRTGTVLAILKSLLTNEDADPVKSIRDSYCEDAVESDIQVKYVERITGKESECQGSFSIFHYGTSKGDDQNWDNLKNLMDWRFYE